MCLLVFAINSHADYPFVFAGNRDEFHERASASANWWEDAPTVFGGRDLEAGGAWLGIRRDGRFAVLTNFRDPDKRAAGAPSRGELVRDFLARDMPDDDMHQWLREDGYRFAGFNIIYGNLAIDSTRLWYFSNATSKPGPHLIGDGIHGLSNHLLNTPWPKVRRSTGRLDRLLVGRNVKHDHLQALLADTAPADDEELPDTDIPLEWERLLSAPRIISPRYGTRASTSLLLHRSGELSVTETSLDAAGNTENTTSARFELSPPSVTMGG